jgi:TRAP-type mannitol/chloroaromatic compound transport system substrate-binding protein
MIAKAQAGPINMRWQSTWPAKDIFHEYALDFAKKVNDMTGGDLKIEVLPAGAVVPAFGLLDAVSKGTLDGGHGVLGYHYGKQNALALWGSGPAYGMDANMLLAWHKYGGGKELLAKLYASIGANVRVVPLRPDADAAAGLVQEAGHQGGGLQGPQVPHRRHLDRRVHGHGRGGQRAARRRDRAGDGPRPARRGRVQQRLLRPPAGLPDVSKVCMLQSYHQNAEQFEIMFNKGKYDALPAKMRAIIANAVEAASADMSWKAIDRYSKDYIELQTKDKVKFYKTPDPVLQKQLTLWSTIMPRRSRRGNPLFKEIAASQKAFAERAVKWDQDTNVSRRMAVQPLLRRQAGRTRQEGLRSFAS